MQRICGVCTTVHAIISVRAVEDAIGAKVPVNAQYIRNMILAAHKHSRPYRAFLSTLRDGLGGYHRCAKADPEKQQIC